MSDMDENRDENVTSPMQTVSTDTGTTGYNGESSSDNESHSAGPGGATGARLRSFIERIERLEEEKAGIAEDIKEVFAEAKSDGFDVKIMRQILKIRKMDEADRAEQEALLETYMSAIGM